MRESGSPLWRGETLPILANVHAITPDRAQWQGCAGANPRNDAGLAVFHWGS